jgi:hypothetical protein
MPTSGGSSFQGGFEVVKRPGQDEPAAARPHDDRHALWAPSRRAPKQLRIEHFVFKPGLSKLDPEQYEADLRVFANKLRKDILPRLLQPASPRGEGVARAGRAAEPSAPQLVLSTEFVELQNRLRELRCAARRATSPGLVMKVAREFFERAVLFLVKDDEARGLAGLRCGTEGRQPQPAGAGRIVIPLQEKSAVRRRWRPPASRSAGPRPTTRTCSSCWARWAASSPARWRSCPAHEPRDDRAALRRQPESGAPLPRWSRSRCSSTRRE